MPAPKLETRFLNSDMSVRAVDDGQDGHRLEGKGVPFNDLSEDLGGFRERISPGAFDLDHTIKSFWSHDSSLVLGSTKVDTLKLEKRSDGIHFSLDLPDTTTGRDAFESIQRGDVDGVSFGFFAHEDRIDLIDGEVIRTILKGELIEISPVAFPAFSQTDVSVELRSRIDALQNAEESASDDESTESHNREILERELELLELDE